MNHKSIIRRNKHIIRRLGGEIREEVISRDDDGTAYARKCYCVNVEINGWTVSAPDRSFYDAYQGAVEAVKSVIGKEPAGDLGEAAFYHLSCDRCNHTWWSTEAFPGRCPFCNKKRKWE